MYPYEDRIRAVELYIKLGKRVADHPSAELPNPEFLDGPAPGV